MESTAAAATCNDSRRPPCRCQIPACCAAEDCEARLLARKQQTAREIEKAMHACAQQAPQPPSEAEMADPATMALFMEAMERHAKAQQAVLAAHDAAVRSERMPSICPNLSWFLLFCCSSTESSSAAYSLFAWKPRVLRRAAGVGASALMSADER